MQTIEETYRQFPSKTLLLVFFVTGLALLSEPFSPSQTQNDVSDNTRIQKKIIELRGNLIHINEIFTSSALLFAATGNEKWLKRYHYFDQLFEGELEKINALLAPSHQFRPPTDMVVFIKERHIAAFDLAKNGEFSNALTLLNDIGYNEQRFLYTNRFDQFIHKLRPLFNPENNSHHQDSTSQYSRINIGIITFLIILWMVVGTKLYKWKTNIHTTMDLEIHKFNNEKSENNYIIKHLDHMSHELRSPLNSLLVLAKNLYAEHDSTHSLSKKRTNPMPDATPSQDNLQDATHEDSILIIEKDEHVNTSSQTEKEVDTVIANYTDTTVSQNSRDIKNHNLMNKTVLLVDDDHRNIFALTRILRTKGMEILSAEDGKQALKLLNEITSIDIVLMDIMMPVMNGYEAIERIREQARFNNLPVLAVTAKAMDSDKKKCLAIGANDYLSKPVNKDTLYSMMDKWLVNE